ncbi:MAG: DUF6515 family protein [Steroidobacteraceae bacterium]
MRTPTKFLWLAATLALGLAVAATGFAAPQQGGRGDRGAARGASHERFDTRYRHNHYYPPRGYAVRELPPRPLVIERARSHYYYSGGAWYRPYGPRFVVVAPPLGLFVPILPPYYTTIWWRGLPYYYANDTYYLWRGQDRAYEVVAPPDDREISTTPPPSDEVFVYPKNGQSEEQTNRDRYECHRWAADQTGFDPTQSAGGASSADRASRRADYFRAMTACLEGRGYSVR